MLVTGVYNQMVGSIEIRNPSQDASDHQDDGKNMFGRPGIPSKPWH